MVKMLAVTVNPNNPNSETEKAWGFCFGTWKQGKPVLDWFPKSQCTYADDILRVPEWLAKKNQMTGWVKLAPEKVWWEINS